MIARTHEAGAHEATATERPDAASAQDEVLLEMRARQLRRESMWPWLLVLVAICSLVYVAYLSGEDLGVLWAILAFNLIRSALAWLSPYVPLSYWHVFLRDASGTVRLVHQLRYRDRVLRQKEVDLVPHTWLRVSEPDNFGVRLELGNPGYKTHVLCKIDYGGGVRIPEAERARDRDALVALGKTVAALTGVEDRGFVDPARAFGRRAT